VKSCVNGISSL
jgi:hypothetical protein